MAICTFGHRQSILTSRGQGQQRRSVLICTARSSEVLPCPTESNGVSWSRRGTAGALAVSLMLAAQPAQAEKLKKRGSGPPEADYTLSEVNGLKYFDEEKGRGNLIKEGDKISVHFDVMFRGIDVVSSRSARLLGGNRTIAEPYEFTAGKEVNGVAAKKINDSAGGLFSGMSGPQPPPALSSAVLGMKQGGKRLVLVNSAALGYGEDGVGEMPPNVPFTLKIEILKIL